VTVITRELREYILHKYLVNSVLYFLIRQRGTYLCSKV